MTTRRMFLCGMAAAVAAAAIPLSTPVLAQQIYRVRRIGEVMVDLLRSDRGHVLVDLFVRDQLILQSGVGDGGFFRWWGPPGDEIMLLADHVLRIETTGGVGGVHLFCRDTLPSGDTRSVLERHDLATGTVETVPLETP